MTKAMRGAAMVRVRTISFSLSSFRLSDPDARACLIPRPQFQASISICFGKTLSIYGKFSQCMNSNNLLAVEPETENDIARVKVFSPSRS
jgi:hypothetical protein